jgi:hypothetical protein
MLATAPVYRVFVFAVCGYQCRHWGHGPTGVNGSLSSALPTIGRSVPSMAPGQSLVDRPGQHRKRLDVEPGTR